MRAHVVFTLMAACGGNSPAAVDAPIQVDATPDAAIDACLTSGGASCFRLPTAALKVIGGTRQLDCTAIPPTQSTSAIGYAGTTISFGDGAALAGTTVDVLYASDLATVAATTTSDSSGAFAMTLPAPVPSVIYTRVAHGSYYDMIYDAVPIDVTGASITNQTLSLLSPSANAALESNLGIADPAGSAYQVIFPNDCNGRGLLNAVATVSSTSSVGNVAPTFVPGTKVFYLDTNLAPVPRSEATSTAGNGFSAYGTTPGQTYYLQTWGFLDGAGLAQGTAGLRLVSEVAIPSVAQTVLVSTVAANQSPQ